MGSPTNGKGNGRRRAAKAKKPGDRPQASRDATTPEGRPEIEIDLAALQELGKIMCSHEEAAGVLRISRATLERRLANTARPEFREAWEAGRAEGRQTLRRYQFKMAETKPVMAIWLGKQYLGQKDERIVRVKPIDQMSEAELLEVLGGEPSPEEFRKLIDEFTDGSGNPSDKILAALGSTKAAGTA